MKTLLIVILTLIFINLLMIQGNIGALYSELGEELNEDQEERLREIYSEERKVFICSIIISMCTMMLLMQFL